MNRERNIEKNWRKRRLTHDGKAFGHGVTTEHARGRGWLQGGGRAPGTADFEVGCSRQGGTAKVRPILSYVRACGCVGVKGVWALAPRAGVALHHGLCSAWEVVCAMVLLGGVSGVCKEGSGCCWLLSKCRDG